MGSKAKSSSQQTMVETAGGRRRSPEIYSRRITMAIVSNAAGIDCSVQATQWPRYIMIRDADELRACADLSRHVLDSFIASTHRKMTNYRRRLDSVYRRIDLILGSTGYRTI